MKTFLLLIALAAPSVFAQTIDGSKTPDQIPDDVAFRLTLASFAAKGMPGPAAAGSTNLPTVPGFAAAADIQDLPAAERLAVQKMDLSGADSKALHMVIQSFNSMIHSATPLTPATIGAATSASAQQLMTPKGWQTFTAYVQGQKAHMRGQLRATTSKPRVNPAEGRASHPHNLQACDPGDVFGYMNADSDTMTVWMYTALEASGGLGGCVANYDSGGDVSGPDGSNSCDSGMSGDTTSPYYLSCAAAISSASGGEVDSYGNATIFSTGGDLLFNYSNLITTIISKHAYGPMSGQFVNPLGPGVVTWYPAACYGRCTSAPYVELTAVAATACAANGGYVQCGSMWTPFYNTCGIAVCMCTTTPVCN